MQECMGIVRLERIWAGNMLGGKGACDGYAAHENGRVAVCTWMMIMVTVTR